MFLPASVDVYVCVCVHISMLVTNFLAPIQVRLPLPHGKKWLNFGRSKVKVGGEVCAVLAVLSLTSCS